MFSAFQQASIRRFPRLVVGLPNQPVSAAVGDVSFMFGSASSSCVLPQQQQQVRWRSNRSRRGLYDGKDVGTGNNVSFSMRATKRTFKPNVFTKRVYSEILDSMIPFHLTTSTLRSIDKAGGLDNYLLDPKRSFTEGEGYKVHKKILKRLKNQARYERKHGLPAAAATSAEASAATTT